MNANLCANRKFSNRPQMDFCPFNDPFASKPPVPHLKFMRSAELLMRR